MHPRLWVFLILIIISLIIVYFQSQLTRIEDDFRNLELSVVRARLRDTPLYEASKLVSNIESDNELVVVYNRVPKTGSTSFVGVAYDLCKRNSFKVLHINITANMHVMSLNNQYRFAQNITTWNAVKPALYHGHMAFLNFDRLGISSKPMYINLIRKPLDRLVSYYYFLRNGDNFRANLIRKKHGDTTSTDYTTLKDLQESATEVALAYHTVQEDPSFRSNDSAFQLIQTFDECVELSQADCDPNNMWLQIPFFCGHSVDCWKPGNRWALEQAKKNLLEYYLVVGVTEEMLDFISILEMTLPRMFKGATQHFLSSNKSHLRQTTAKVTPSDKTIEVMQRSTVWKMENELYEFALEQFNFIKKKTLLSKDPSSVVQTFFYEKVRPK